MDDQRSYIPKGYVCVVGIGLKLEDLKVMQSHCAECLFLDNCSYARAVDNALEKGRAPFFIEPFHYIKKANQPDARPKLICLNHEHVAETHR